MHKPHDLDHLRAFHREIFGDIYPWAGEIRVVVIARSDPFCLPQHIEAYSAEVFGQLMKERYLHGTCVGWIVTAFSTG